MSRIDELTNEFCPNGVERPALEEVISIQRGKRITKGELDPDGRVPVVSGGQGFMGFTTQSNREANTITIAQYGAAGFVNWQDQPFWANDVCYSVVLSADCLDYRFLYYFLKSQQDHLYNLSNRVAVPYSIEADKILSTPIPLPPLEVQREIVSILDKFTQLEGELEAELEARRIQYEVTRDRLLDFSGDLQGHPLRDELHSLNTGSVKQKKLGEAGQFIRGSGLEKKDLLGSGEPVVHYGEVHTHYGFWTATTKSFVSAAQAKKMRKAAPGDVVIVTTSENHEDVGKPLAWLGSQPLNVGGESYIYQSELDPLYVAQLFMSSSFKRMSRRYISGTKVKRLSSDNLERIEIPVPPLEIQRKIGVALKDLDALLNDITIGLPAEIAARRKQYEFYRNKLLTFKEVEAA